MERADVISRLLNIYILFVSCSAEFIILVVHVAPLQNDSIACIKHAKHIVRGASV